VLNDFKNLRELLKEVRPGFCWTQAQACGYVVFVSASFFCLRLACACIIFECACVMLVGAAIRFNMRPASTCVMLVFACMYACVCLCLHYTCARAMLVDVAICLNMRPSSYLRYACNSLLNLFSVTVSLTPWIRWFKNAQKFRCPSNKK
jgi:hypothetical protein